MKRLQFSLFTLTAEVGYLYPLYYLVAIGLKTPAAAMLSIWACLGLALLAVLVNGALAKRRRRTISKIVINILFAGGLALWLLKNPSIPSLFSITDGLLALLQKWNLISIVFWCLLRAMVVFRKAPSYPLAVSRFEIGLAIIFGVFLLASLLNISIPYAMVSLMLFFLSNGGNLSLTKWGEQLAPSWSGLGLVIVLLTPLALTIGFLLPVLKNMAGNIYRVATPILIFVRDRFAKVIIFIFGGGRKVGNEATYSLTEDFAQGPIACQTGDMPIWVDFIFKIIARLVLGVFLIIIVLLIFYLIRKLILKLLKVEMVQQEGVEEENWLSWVKGILFRIKKSFEDISRFIFVLIPREISISQAYNGLLFWGALRKYPRWKQETPYEYNRRLANHFPQQKANLAVITDSYVAYKYGNKELSKEKIKQVEKSLRKLYLSIFTQRK